MASVCEVTLSDFRVPEMPSVNPYLGYRGLLNPVFRSTAPETPNLPCAGPFALPLVVAGKVYVLPAEWGEVFEQLGIDGLTIPG
jgi:hypothetical protein